MNLPPASYFSPRLSVLSVLVGLVWGLGFSAALRASAPPHWPDETHVANGCYLSATVYIEKLRAWDSSARARTATVVLPDSGQHTLVVVEMGAEVYGRDQYIGVFRIRGGDVQKSFSRAMAVWLTQGGTHSYERRNPATTVQRKNEVERAARMLGFLSPLVLTVPTPDGDVAALAWRTPDNLLAVYEPTIGTAVTGEPYAPEDIIRVLLKERARARRAA